MAENLEQSETVKAWADIVVKMWEDKVYKYKALNTYDLAKSFLVHAHASANGDIARVEFLYNYYGKFVDMGVGKGTKLIGSDSAAVTSLANRGYSVSNIVRHLQNQNRPRRRKKPWYTPVFYSQVKRLVEILSEKYARKAALTIVENIDDNALKWDKQHLRL